MAYSRMTTQVDMAKRAMAKGRSYRPKPFKVGAALLIVTTEGVVKYETGENVKLSQNAHKLCAEMNAFTKALDNNGAFWIVSVAIVGQPMEDDVSHVRSDTLHSCAKCRKLFEDLTRTPVVVNNFELGCFMELETPIFTSLPGRINQFGEEIVEPTSDVHTLREMLSLHNHAHP